MKEILHVELEEDTAQMFKEIDNFFQCKPSKKQKTEFLIIDFHRRHKRELLKKNES